MSLKSHSRLQVSLPAVLKVESGCGAVGTKHVSTIDEVKAHVLLVENMLRADERSATYIGQSHSRSLLLTPLLVGTEHSVDVVLFEGRLVTAFITDKGPTRLPWCLATTATLPSLLSQGTCAKSHSVPRFPILPPSCHNRLCYERGAT